MNVYFLYGIIFVILLALELAYFQIADRCNIIDKPNERSSHSTIVLRGGGIIFLLGAWVWALKGLIVDGLGFMDCYPFFLIALTLVAGVSFVDDIHSLPDSGRLVAQFISMGLMFYQLDMLHWNIWWMVIIALIVCVGATNIINFMDGINGITSGYAISVIVSLAIVNATTSFIEPSFLYVVLLALIVFSIFNFRPKGKAKCFAGDVGSIGIGFIMLFCIGLLIMQTSDFTWLIFLLVYGIDGLLTICHRILLHENLGEAHRKHVFQIMANELKMGHVTVTCIYMAMQLCVSLGFIYLCPLLASALGLSIVVCHWGYLAAAFVILAAAYILFKKKYYHLHEEYLASLNK